MSNVPLEFAVGSLAGILDCVLLHWVDTFKVRRQDGRALLLDLKTGGALSFKGMAPPAAAGAAFRSAYAGFSTNFSLKVPYMAGMFACMEANRVVLDATERFLGRELSPTARQAVCAALTGVEVSLLLSPLEMVRIQGQNCGKGGLFDATRAVLDTAPRPRSAAGVVRTFGRGLGATSQRELKYCLGQFFLCGIISREVAAALGGDAERDFLPNVVGACLGGVACTAVSHPDDVIKTRMQTHLRGSQLHGAYGSYLSSLRYILQTEGVAALFKSAAIRCLVRVPLGLTVITLSSSVFRKALEPAFAGGGASAERASLTG
uniref:Mitochondrial carrier protein n=1 Tax=Phaeomonas parva TaxID=124430 RepID=A0A7S1U8J2_9STRA